MPLRRRRDGAPTQARTEEQSSGHVRVPARQKAPRSFQRCCPSRGGIREGPRPERRGEGDSRPHDKSSRRPGCSKRYEEGTRESSKTARLPLLGRLGPQSVPSTQVERDVRKPARTDRGSQVPSAATHHGTNATGIGWCRRVAGRKPHSRARVERSSGVPARRRIGCRSRQATPRLREARLPLATGRVDGSLASEGPKGSAGVKRRRTSGWRRPSRHADEVRSRTLERALRGDGPCSMEDTSDLCGSAHRSREREAGDLGGSQGGACSRERHDHHEGGDRGVRGSVRTRRGGKTTPTETAPRGERATRRSESP